MNKSCNRGFLIAHLYVRNAKIGRMINVARELFNLIRTEGPINEVIWERHIVKCSSEPFDLPAPLSSVL